MKEFSGINSYGLEIGRIVLFLALILTILILQILRCTIMTLAIVTVASGSYLRPSISLDTPISEILEEGLQTIDFSRNMSAPKKCTMNPPGSSGSNGKPRQAET